MVGGLDSQRQSPTMLVTVPESGQEGEGEGPREEEETKETKKSQGRRDKSPTAVLERAIHANPNDPFAWHLLGVHCHSKRSYDEAYRCFARAEQIKAGFSASNQFYLAACLKERGARSDALRVLNSAINLPARNAVDKKGQKCARQLLEAMTGLRLSSSSPSSSSREHSRSRESTSPAPSSTTTTTTTTTQQLKNAA